MNFAEGWRRSAITVATIVGLGVSAVAGIPVFNNLPSTWPTVPSPLRFRCQHGSLVVAPQETIQDQRRQGCNPEPGQTLIMGYYDDQKLVPVENIYRIKPEDSLAIGSQQGLSDTRDRMRKAFQSGLLLTLIGGPAAAFAVLAAARLIKWVVSGFFAAAE
jgi:hypothetical protein